eukprot:306381-Chlamydomonas_euryale.AAC.8
MQIACMPTALSRCLEPARRRLASLATHAGDFIPQAASGGVQFKEIPFWRQKLWCVVGVRATDRG